MYIAFNKFLSISGIDKLVNQFKSNSKDEIIKQAQFLLEMNNYDAYATMISKGYKANLKQQKMIDKYVDNILSHSPVDFCSNIGNTLYKKLEILLENGLQLNYFNVTSFMCHRGFFFSRKILDDPNYILEGYNREYLENYEKERITSYFPHLTKQINQILKEDDFCTYLSNEFKMSLKNDFINKIKGKNCITLEKYEIILEYAPQLIFKNTTFEEINKIIKKLNYSHISESHSTILNNIVNKLYKKDMNNIFDKTQSNFSANMVESLTMKAIKNEQHNIKDLPKSALILVNDIEIIYKKIKDNGCSDIDKISQLNNLLEKRIPEILGKYLKVDLEYRLSMTSSQGKNAEDLMIDSLTNIKVSFNNVYEQMNQQTVDSLSATNRYTQSIKM